MQNNLSQSRVLVIGDIMLDRYYHGGCDRISPEAPVPVVAVKEVYDRAGGAGNVALNISELKGHAGICALVGKDHAADELMHFLDDKSITVYFEATDLPTILKLRVLSQKQQLLRMDFEESFATCDKSALIRQVEAVIDDYNVLVLSDYGKGTLSCANELIDMAKKRNITVLVDPKGVDFSRYYGASLITPNMKEFEAVAGKCHSEDEIVCKAKGLMAEYDLTGLLITRSEKGMMLVLKDKEAVSIPTEAREVYDVTGAGDTVIAVMAMALSCQFDYVSAMRLANAAAGVVVGKLGTATVNPDELNKAMHKGAAIDRGIMTEGQIKQVMEEARLQGEKIVMTNGCFDILHAGHVEYLTRARQLGDRLIVAINSDASVSRLKGKNRPIVPLSSRMEVLAGLAAVDWVVAFDEDTPRNIISTLLPDVLVKGKDYAIDEIAGAKEVVANGGEVITIELKPEHSSSNIISKIQSL
ncbi:MAG: bifunctional D-glycero-beta-D-manno-heptose-7-phosphate kinase/D-glycero-beta-D-manno-heptose 1-phosphate adenylyltransferase HldE [Francisellaceae bacterium]